MEFSSLPGNLPIIYILEIGFFVIPGVVILVFCSNFFPWNYSPARHLSHLTALPVFITPSTNNCEQSRYEYASVTGDISCDAKSVPNAKLDVCGDVAS